MIPSPLVSGIAGTAGPAFLTNKVAATGASG